MSAAAQASATDVLVVGGGLVGASLAIALDSLGYAVTLLEAVEPRTDSSPSYDDRTLALGQASCRILDGLGLWSALEGHATPIREVEVTELRRPARAVLRAGELGLDRFGAVVEARVFGQAVMSRLAELPGIEMVTPAVAVGLEPDEEQVLVHAEVEGARRSWRARLVVGADGADSAVRSLLGIDAHHHDYGQVAVICNVTPEVPHDNRAFERMTPTGPFALLPHVGERCGLVWCVPADEADDLLAWPEAEFLARATERSGRALGALGRLGRRSAYPLRRVVPARDTDQRAVLLGNAAHAIHPVGAQGFNLGLRDVAVLAEVLADARPDDGERPDPGDPVLLEAYADWRGPDRAATVGWTHDMVSLFGSEAPLTRSARGLGLAAVGLLPPLRRRLASRAMGYRGRVPRLALGEALEARWDEAP